MLITHCIRETVECLKFCTTKTASAVAYICLFLLEDLGHSSLDSLGDDLTRPSLAHTLETLLKRHSAVSYGVDMHSVIAVLKSGLDVEKSLYISLRSSLRSPSAPTESPATRNESRLRLTILGLACGLKRFLEQDQKSMLASRLCMRDQLGELHVATAEIRKLATSFPGKYSEISSLTLELYSNKVFHITHQLQTNFRIYPELEPLITQLTSAISAAGLFHEAELLFSILQSTQSRQLLAQRRTQISLQYCLHLERNRAWEPLSRNVLEAYEDFSNLHPHQFSGDIEKFQTSRGARILIRWMKKIIDANPGVSHPPGSSDADLDTRELYNLDEEFPPSPVSSDSEESEDEDRRRGISEPIVIEDDEDEAKTNDKDSDDIDDCKSSNKFGVTYTESGITGLSFNYSDLYR